LLHEHHAQAGLSVGVKVFVDALGWVVGAANMRADFAHPFARLRQSWRRGEQCGEDDLAH